MPWSVTIDRRLGMSGVHIEPFRKLVDCGDNTNLRGSGDRETSTLKELANKWSSTLRLREASNATTVVVRDNEVVGAYGQISERIRRSISHVYRCSVHSRRSPPRLPKGESRDVFLASGSHECARTLSLIACGGLPWFQRKGSLGPKWLDGETNRGRQRGFHEQRQIFAMRRTGPDC
jgi:hypothetical protein